MRKHLYSAPLGFAVATSAFKIADNYLRMRMAIVASLTVATAKPEPKTSDVGDAKPGFPPPQMVVQEIAEIQR